MIRVWRLCRRRHRAFDGAGARLFGGRWNHRGTAIVYASGDPALAVLEYFVHLELEDAPSDLVLAQAAIPDRVRIETLRADQLPSGWRSLPAPEDLAELGTAWAERLRSAVVSVPSALVPVARNYLINPAHPDFRSIVVGRSEPFPLDPRLSKRR